MDNAIREFSFHSEYRSQSENNIRDRTPVDLYQLGSITSRSSDQTRESGGYRAYMLIGTGISIRMVRKNWQQTKFFGQCKTQTQCNGCISIFHLSRATRGARNPNLNVAFTNVCAAVKSGPFRACNFFRSFFQ